MADTGHKYHLLAPKETGPMTLWEMLCNWYWGRRFPRWLRKLQRESPWFRFTRIGVKVTEPDMLKDLADQIEKRRALEAAP